MTTQDIFLQLMLVIAVAGALDLIKHFVLKSNPRVFVRYIFVCVDVLAFSALAALFIHYDNMVFALIASGMGLYSLTFLPQGRIQKFE